MRAIVLDVAHALVRAVFALLRTQSCRRVQPGVHTSVNAARRSACATIIFAALLFADSQADVLEVFASMAAGISDNNPSEFLKALDKNMPGYGDLKVGIEALVNQAELASSVEPIKNEGDDSKRTVDLDWYLQIRSRLPDGPIVNRRKVIHCELRKEGKHWKIVSLQPREFFSPAKL